MSYKEERRRGRTRRRMREKLDFRKAKEEDTTTRETSEVGNPPLSLCVLLSVVFPCRSSRVVLVDLSPRRLDLCTSCCTVPAAAA
jgi:hypothetical protein